MKLTIYQADNTIAIAELDKQVFGGPQALEFANALSEFAAGSSKCVVVDLSGIELMNSSGLGMLVSGLTSLRKFDGSLKLANVAGKVRDLLSMTRLDTLFEMYDSVEDAIRSWENRIS